MTKERVESIVALHYVLMFVSLICFANVSSWICWILIIGFITSAIILNNKKNNMQIKQINIFSYLGAIFMFAIILGIYFKEQNDSMSNPYPGFFDSTFSDIAFVISIGGMIGTSLNLIGQLIYYKFFFKEDGNSI